MSTACPPLPCTLLAPPETQRVTRVERNRLHLPINGFSSSSLHDLITVRLIDDNNEREQACSLLNRAYSQRGYGDDHRIAASENHATFTASCESGLIGTITLACDSPAGMAADATFPDEISKYRSRPGAKLCELTRFAFEANASSKSMLASLFHVVLMFGSQRYGCTDLFIEVSRRHARFYESMLEFERVGDFKKNSSVATDAQLMHLSVHKIKQRIRECAGDLTKAKSLYPYFLSGGSEDDLCRRMLEAFDTSKCLNSAEHSSSILLRNSLHQPGRTLQ